MITDSIVYEGGLLQTICGLNEMFSFNMFVFEWFDRVLWEILENEGLLERRGSLYVSTMI